MSVDCNIDSVINYLQQMKEKGFKTVEVIDDVRAAGWMSENPSITFIRSDRYPTLLGIDARTRKE